MNILNTIVGDLRTIIEGLKRDGLGKTAQLLHSRDAPALAQFAKYGICGVGAVIVHHIVFVGLTMSVMPIAESSGLSPESREHNSMLANLISWPFSNVFAYLMNILWVFTPGRHSKWREFALFSGISFLSFGVGLLGGPVFISEGVHEWIGQFGFVVTSALVNFVCRKFLVFQK